MQRYVKRGFEDEICNVLNEHGVICLIGLPGVGKTTTSRYIAVKMQRERRKENKEVPIVVLRHKRAVEKRIEPRIIEFYDENGEKHKIQAVSFGVFWERKPNEIKYLAKLVVRIANKSFFDRMKLRKMDAGSLANIFRDIFGEFSDALKEHIENSLRDYRDRVVDMSQLLFVLGLSFLGSLAPSRAIRGILKEDAKLKGELIFIVDDIADLTPGELSGVIKFVRWLKDSGAKVILVRRIEFEEYPEICENLYGEKPFDFNKVFGGARNLIKKKKQFHLMEAAEREEFEEMLKANGYEKGEIRRALKTKREDVVDLLYSASVGSISIALMTLDAGISAEKIQKSERQKRERYLSAEEIREERDWKEREEIVLSNIAIVSDGIKSVYEKIREKNFALLALFAQDVAEEELEQFCEDSAIKYLCILKGYHLFWDLEGFSWMLESYKEPFAERERKVYTLNRRWGNMRSFVKALEDEEIKKEMRTIRQVLLEIMTADREKYGWYTGRMLLCAFENIEWLKEREIFMLKEALFWGRAALHGIPSIGFQFIKVVRDLWKKEEHDDEILLYAAVYAWQLVEQGIGVFSNPKEYLALVKLAEEFMKEETKDDAVLCWRAVAYSSSAFGLTRTGQKEELAEYYLRKAEKIIESMRELKELAESEFYFYKGKINKVMGINPFEWMKKSKEYLRKAEKIGITETMRRFLKPLEGEPEKAFKGLLNEWYSAIYLYLGTAYGEADKIKEARKYFEKVLDLYDESHKLEAKDILGKIEVIEKYKFEWKVKEEKISFKNLWNICKSILPTLTAEYIACTCAEYLVSEIVRGEFKREDLEYAKLDPDAFSLLNGIGCIFGFIDKRDAVEELKKLDLRWLSAGVRSSGGGAERLVEVMEGVVKEGAAGPMGVIKEIIEEKIMETIKKPIKKYIEKKYIEELYNSALDPTRRWKYEIIKEAEVIEREPIWCIVFNSTQALARVMLFYIANYLEYAQILADKVSKIFYAKLPSRLFKELAEAIKREREGDKDAKEDVKRAFVKLFYYHI